MDLEEPREAVARDQIAKFNCRKCKLKCRTKSSLLHHMKKVHSRITKSQSIDKAERKLDLKSDKGSDMDLEEPSQNFSPVEAGKYKCPKCQLNFDLRALYLDHLKTVHPKEKLHKCTVCPAAFKSFSTLKQHRRAEKHYIGEYRCQVCVCRYETLGALRAHETNYHPEIGKIA